jgi:hypothetical protein
MNWWKNQNPEFRIGFSMTFGRGIKPKDIVFGSGCVAHKDLTVRVYLGWVTWSRRYWLNKVKEKPNGTTH